MQEKKEEAILKLTKVIEKLDEDDINEYIRKVGQKVAVYNYGDTLEDEHINLRSVRMIVVLDDEL